MVSRFLLIAGLLGLLVVSVAPAAESAVTPVSLTELTLKADLILRGRVTQQSSAWDEGKHLIFTEHTLEILDEIKGPEAMDKLVVRTPGGVVGEIGLLVEPAPRFAVGEDVLVFLEPASAGHYRVTASVHGKYALEDGWAFNDAKGTMIPLTTLVRDVLTIMDAHGIASGLPSDWESRFPPATVNPPSRHPQSAEPQAFTYNGRHWAGPDPMGEDYLVNVNTSDVPSDEALQAIQAAGDTWSDVASADFVFSYGGSTSATDYGYNNDNEILWKSSGTNGTLGTTWTWWYDDSNEIIEADMVINDSYQWDTSGSPSDSEYDLESVVLHEFGHYLHLGHDDEQGTVMYPSIAAGAVVRTLHQNDIDGISHIYPGDSSEPCLADFDTDGSVTMDDVSEITDRWGLEQGDSGYADTYDLNGDGVIDVSDISLAILELDATCG